MKTFAQMIFVPALLLALALPTASCKTTSSRSKDTAILKTSVIYRERILLPRKATITVTLEDVSKMDVASTVITRNEILAEGSQPYAVNLEYKANMLNKTARYAVRARIEENGRLLFINDTHIDPFAGPAGETVEILVKSVAR